ncbi:hypothetical protein [Nocardia sp. NPDC050406]|uniref:hypothetical protein n=1 Tax=Nocardia sp. NPDC050406 TaxID=3364318 RepID=UPI0037B48BC6
MGLTNPMGSKSPFPTIEFARVADAKPSVGSKLSFAGLVAVFIAIPGMWVAILISDGIGKSPVVVVGACGVIVGSLGLLLMICPPNPWGRKHSARIRHHLDATHGSGISIGARDIMLPIVLVLAGGAAYAIAAWVGWKLGDAGGLLPLSKTSSGGATFVLIVGLILAGALILVFIARMRTSLELYPAGIRRMMVYPVLRRLREQFIEWDEVDSIEQGVHRQSGSGATIELSLIDVRLLSPRTPVQRRDWDTPEKVALPAYLLDCDPHRLLAIMRFLKDHPEQRHLLARPDAPIWFTAEEKAS